MVTHLFDSGSEGEPYTATIRLTGSRSGVSGKPTAADSLAQTDSLPGIVPGIGPVSVTSWIYGINPGLWTVTAELVRPMSAPADGRRRPRDGASVERLQPAAWSWRHWAAQPTTRGEVKTRWAMLAPLARIPAVQPGSWPLLAGLGAVVGLLVQAAVAVGLGISWAQTLGVSLIAVLVGLVGAKVWFAILHKERLMSVAKGGWSVDGFLAVTLVTALIVTTIARVSIGAFLDAGAPGLFLGVAIGRLGCFFTGCCAGRYSPSRWAIWSSDRRIGARRVPAQLLESGFGLAMAMVTLAIVAQKPAIQGVVFLVSFGAYIMARQAFLRLRAERRDYSWRRSAQVVETHR